MIEVRNVVACKKESRVFGKLIHPGGRYMNAYELHSDRSGEVQEKPVIAAVGVVFLSLFDKEPAYKKQGEPQHDYSNFSVYYP